MRHWALCLMGAFAAAGALAAGNALPPPGVNMAAELQAEFERGKAAQADRAAGEAGTPPSHLRQTYTAAQLAERMARKSPPDQWPPVSTRRPMGYGECLLAVKEVADTMRLAGLPVEQIVMTSALWVTKIWATDAAVVLTCSQADRVQITTRSYYRKK